MNKLFRNKFLRENLILVIVFALIFPPHAFSDVWVADTGNDQVSRLYKYGHAPTVMRVTEVGESDTIAVNINPTGLFYPGLKISFGKDRANVYEIDSVDSDLINGWTITFTISSPNVNDDVADSPIYMELERAGGFDGPVSVSANQSNTNCWIADNSSQDSGVTQITGWGRNEPNDTGIVTPYYHSSFDDGDTMFNLYSRDKSIYPGIKIDFKSDNRAGYVLETKAIDKTSYPYILETISGLPLNHSIIDQDTAVIHIDRFRDKAPIFPQDVFANSTSDRNDPEYDIAWVADTVDNSVKKYEKWGYRRALSIDYTKIGGELENFPLCVKLDSSRITYTSSNGADIRFTDFEGNPLKYEVEKWDDTDADTSVVWVRVTEISSTDTTIIYMFYGNPDASDKQDAGNVWDENYMMVQHLEETVSSDSHYDSTFNNNDGEPYITPEGNMNAVGKINGADEFDGTNDYIEIADNESIRLNSKFQDFTISTWVKRGTSDNEYILDKRDAGNDGWSFRLVGNKIRCRLNTISIESSSIVDTDWHHLSCVVDRNGDGQIYIDGVADGNPIPINNEPMDTANALLIGARFDKNSEFFNGTIDEVRISNIIRSDTWIKASYYSENDELITFGDEENIRYAGILKVGGFNSPQSISVNSVADSNDDHYGEVWVADKENKAVVKLCKEGYETINAVVNIYHSEGDDEITLTDVSELDSGINISFNNNFVDTHRITNIIESDTQIEITPGLNEALHGEFSRMQWATAQPLELDLEAAASPQIAMSGDTVVSVWIQNDGLVDSIYSNHSTDGGATWIDTVDPLPLEWGPGAASSPQIAISGDKVVAVWVQNDGTADSIYSNHSTDGGATWGASQPLETTSGLAYFPQIAMSGDKVVAVWFQMDGTKTRIYSNHSTDGGATWIDTVDPLLLETSFPWWAYSPQIAMNGDKVVAVWTQSDGTADSIYSNHSTNGGESWIGAQLLENSDSGDARYPQIAMSGDKVVAVWRQMDDLSKISIYSNHSIDGGATWIDTVDPLLLDNSDLWHASYPQIAMSGDKVVAVWYHWEGTTYDVRSNHSTDGGQTWLDTDPPLLETGFSWASHPQVAISGSNAVAVWQSNNSNYSTDGGANWMGAQFFETDSVSSPQVVISGSNAVVVYSTADNIYSNHTTFIAPLFPIPVGRELARISGFSSPVAVSVDSKTGDCWMADGSDTVIWIRSIIGNEYIPSTAGYNINTDSGYHKIITGFDNPVSVSVDPASGDCWVACEGTDGGDSYIVKLESSIPNNYDIRNYIGHHVKVYGFNSPQAVSVDPTTGECWVADKGDQIVKLSPDGHKYTGYIVVGGPVDGTYDIGDTIIYLETGPWVLPDTDLYRPLKISFGAFTTDIKPVYEISKVTYGNSAEIELASGLTEPISDLTRVYKELVRVGGFAFPSDVSAFEGPDLGELGLHPWSLQIRELYVVDEAEYTDGWKAFPNNTPVHDATPQFRWQYIDIDGSGGSPLKSYQIRIYSRDSSGNFVPVWDSGELDVQSGIPSITQGTLIHTDWDKVLDTVRENDSKSIYSADYYTLPQDPDDCSDLSQDEIAVSDTGNRTYYVQLTVTNENDVSDTYPYNNGDPLSINGVSSEDTPIITFILDKTPPGSYRVCGTQVHVPATSDDNIKDNRGDLGSGNTYYQTHNYYWDEVWVQWDGGETEIVREDSPWIDKKEVTVRVKVKDANNENDPQVVGFPHLGHGLTEGNEEDTDCSGISFNKRDAQYRYRSTSMTQWSEWKPCHEIRLFDEDAADSQGKEMNITDENRNTFVWLYAKNVKFDNGDTNLIQFRIKDEGDLEVTRDLGDTIVWIAPNMGYSHADTETENFYGEQIEYQTASSIYGYPIQIDTDIPEVILINYPSNPFPHRFASFKWIGIDTTPCRYKWKLEHWDGNDWVFQTGNSIDYSNDTEDWSTIPGTDAISTNFTSLDLEVGGKVVGNWYRFWVKAKDNDGVNSGAAIERQISDDVPPWVWFVSPEVPNTIITAGPSGQVYNTNFTFRWRGIGGKPPYSYAYKVTGINWQYPPNGVVDRATIESVAGFGAFEVGKTYVFEARVTDDNGSGQTDPTPARRIFTVVDPDHPPYSTISPDNLYKYFREMGE